MLVHSGKILSLKRACFLGGDAEKSGVRDKGIWGRGSDEEKKSQKSSRAEKEQMGTWFRNRQTNHLWTDRQTEEQTEEQTDRGMDRQTKDFLKSPMTPSIEDFPQSLATENAFNLLFLTKQRKT